MEINPLKKSDNMFDSFPGVKGAEGLFFDTTG